MEKHCGLCLKSVGSEDDFTKTESITVEIFDILLSKPGESLKENSIICNTCSEILQRVFDFKCTCLYTEDVLYPLVKSDEMLDIKDVYIGKHGESKAKDIPEVPKICRLCLDLIDRGYPLQMQIGKSMGTVINTVQTYLPELNLKAVKRPLVCKTCLEALKLYANFIGKYMELGNSMESENIVIEEVERDIDLESRNLQDIAIEKNDGECDANNILNGASENEDQAPSEFCDYERMIGTSKRRKRIAYRSKRYRCRHCGYHAGELSIMRKHILQHLSASQVVLHKCGICNFETKYKQSLKTHLSKHLEQVFNCDECKHKFKSLSSYVNHKLEHERIKSRQFECAWCEFKTKHKTTFDYHRLNHKDESEVELMICDICGYTTRHRSLLREHMSVHRVLTVSEMKRCPKCTYVARTKERLRRHLRTHEDVTNSKMFKCNICAYQSRYKEGLKVHAVIHMSSAEAIMYECDLCTFKSKREGSVRKHRMTHMKKNKS